MPAYPWFESVGAQFIEHGHRLLAMATGFATIALVIALWRCEPRRWVRLFGVALLVGVVLQGVLGGQRVLLDERAPDQARVIALIHGCSGPLFFAAAAAMAVVTSRRWRESQADTTPGVRKLFRLAVVTAAITYMQLVVGAVVRHSPMLLAEGAGAIFQTAVYFHVLLAAAVTLHIVLVAIRCWRTGCRPGIATAIVGLILVQVLLGGSSWVVKYGMPSWFIRMVGETGHFNRATDVASAAILASHGAVGALIVALTVVVALTAGRRFGLAAAPVIALAATRSAGGLA
jgi:cytochrome c oxidase assembly protein subunit 15